MDVAPVVAIVAEEAGFEMIAEALSVALLEFAFEFGGIKALFGPELGGKPNGLKSVPTTELCVVAVAELTDGNNGLFGNPGANGRANECGTNDGGGCIAAPKGI